MPLKHYAVVGRIPEDDEDSGLFFETTGKAKAIKLFDRETWEDLESRPKVRRELRADTRRAHGHTTFITHVLRSNTPFTYL